jgi:hypothetical protein
MGRRKIPTINMVILCNEDCFDKDMCISIYYVFHLLYSLWCLSERYIQLVSAADCPVLVLWTPRVLRGVGEAHVIHAQDDLPWWTSAFEWCAQYHRYFFNSYPYSPWFSMVIRSTNLLMAICFLWLFDMVLKRLWCQVDTVLQAGAPGISANWDGHPRVDPKPIKFWNIMSTPD